MIVQATNTGSDVGSTQFDLAVCSGATLVESLHSGKALTGL